MKKLVNGVEIDMTPEEIAEVLAHREQALLRRQSETAKSHAMFLLEKSDITILRMIESGITNIPPDWANYRAVLRQVVRGETLTIPQTPEYP